MLPMEELEGRLIETFGRLEQLMLIMALLVGQWMEPIASIMCGP